MPNDETLRLALQEIVDTLQVIAPVAAQLRRTLGEQAQDVALLEAAAARAVRVLRALQPKEGS